MDGQPRAGVSEPGTAELRQLAALAPRTCSHSGSLRRSRGCGTSPTVAIHNATDEDLDTWGGYSGVPADRVAFDIHVYAHC
jgi:hypothetical protein